MKVISSIETLAGDNSEIEITPRDQFENILILT